jgi:hypothetical protein
VRIQAARVGLRRQCLPLRLVEQLALDNTYPSPVPVPGHDPDAIEVVRVAVLCCVEVEEQNPQALPEAEALPL